MERKNYLKPISTKVEFEGMENVLVGTSPTTPGGGDNGGESGSGEDGDVPGTGDGPMPAAINPWEENN